MRLVIVGPVGVDANEVVHPSAGLDLVRVRDGRRYPLTDPVTTLGASLANSVVVAGAGAALVAAGVVRRAEGWYVVAQPRAPPPLVAGRPVDAIAPVALDQEITVAGEVFRLSATGGSAAHQGGGGSGCAGAGDSVVRP